MAYGLRPVLPKPLFVKMVEAGVHKKLAKIPNRFGVDPAVFFVPRLLSGVTFGYDLRSKYLAQRFAAMLRYSLLRKARSRARGLRARVA
jgi:hypothetical protein